jgi:hypothetical protein
MLEKRSSANPVLSRVNPWFDAGLLDRPSAPEAEPEPRSVKRSSPVWRTLLFILCIFLMSALCYLMVFMFCAEMVDSMQPIMIYPVD